MWRQLIREPWLFLINSFNPHIFIQHENKLWIYALRYEMYIKELVFVEISLENLCFCLMWFYPFDIDNQFLQIVLHCCGAYRNAQENVSKLIFYENHFWVDGMLVLCSVQIRLCFGCLCCCFWKMPVYKLN